LDLNSKEALLSALRSTEKPVAFLVGSPLSADSSGRGVPGVDQMLDLIRAEVAHVAPEETARFEEEVQGSGGIAAYQAAFGWLQANISQDAVNHVVQQAVLQACRDPAAVETPDGQLTDGRPQHWHIPDATRALADLVCNSGEFFGGPILTTNFDPLLSLAVREAGAVPSRRVLDFDAALPRDVEEETDTRSIVHLHGYWRGSDTLHTPGQLRSQRPRLRASLQSLLRSHLFVVIGYGGWDDVFTAALAELLTVAQADVEVVWCFNETESALVEARYGSLLKAVEPAIARGRFRSYRGIDCHTIFEEIAQAVQGRPAVRPSGASPLGGWVLVDETYLSALAPLSDDEVLRYFDGAVPSWRHAVSDAIPQRQIVPRLVSDINRARAAHPCSIHLIAAAGGEGKSTVLRQVAADAALQHRWTVLWRPDPHVQLESEQVAGLNAEQNWLLVADDAESLVRSLFSSAGRLHELGRSNVHFLLASRDSDWRAAGGYGRPWASRLTVGPDAVLRGVTHEDAQRIVDAWSARGAAGLSELGKLVTRAERVHAFEEAVADEERGRTEGSFFGGLLAARLGEAGLQAHVREFLARLQHIEIEDNSNSLFDALLYVAACHAVDIPGVNENVLADLLEVPRGRIHGRAVRPLGEEAAAVRTVGHVLTRHTRVAAAVLVEADAAFDVDLPEIWGALVGQTIRTGRDVRMDRRTYSSTVHASSRLLRRLPRQIPEDRRKETAIASARASVEVEPERATYVVDLGRVYRAAGRLDEASRVFRDHLATLESKVDYESDVRGYWYEWGVCEGERGSEDAHAAANAWIAGLSLSDNLAPAPITTENAKLISSGLGVAFGKLARPSSVCPFARGRRAVAYLGWRANPDRLTASYLDRYDRDADAIGTPRPEGIEQALDWVETGVRAAWAELNDDFLRGLADPSQVTFAALAKFFSETSVRSAGGRRSHHAR